MPSPDEGNRKGCPYATIMINILIAEDLSPPSLSLLDAPDVRVDNRRLSRDELLNVIHDYDGLIIRWVTRVDEELLSRAKKLRVIGRAGSSLDNINLDAATRRGVMVTTTPLINSIASAEYTMGLLLAVARNIPQAHGAVQKGEWRSRRNYIGVELQGKTLGLIGFGRIGRQVAERAAAFGMNVIACDPYIDDADTRGVEVTLVDLDELLERSDFISLHTPLNDETKNLIGAEEIARMKNGVRIVNTARGGLADEAALAAAVRSGKVAALAVDTFAVEPPESSPLIGIPNVITTPHLGASTREALDAVSTQIVQQTLDALRGTDYRNVINLPFIEGAEFRALRPQLVLAEKIGSLQRQLAATPLKRIEIEVRGLSGLIKPLTVALLKGVLGGEVNYINAPLVAQERRIVITQAEGFTVGGLPEFNFVPRRVGGRRTFNFGNVVCKRRGTHCADGWDSH